MLHLACPGYLHSYFGFPILPYLICKPCQLATMCMYLKQVRFSCPSRIFFWRLCDPLASCLFGVSATHLPAWPAAAIRDLSFSGCPVACETFFWHAKLFSGRRPPRLSTVFAGGFSVWLTTMSSHSVLLVVAQVVISGLADGSFF